LTPVPHKAFGGSMNDRRPNRRVLGRVTALIGSAFGVAAFMAERKRRRLRELDLVGKSGLFDSEWYLHAYPDVAEAGVDPLHHYMSVGWREGRDPGPEFATSSYLKANADVAAAGANPLLHFVEFGHQEGRGSSTHRPAPKPFTPPAGGFGAAAPCVSFALADEAPIRWTRGYRLRPRADLVSIGDCVVGYAPDEAIRAELRSSFALLHALSGDGAAGEGRPAMPQSGGRLLDAWFVNAAQLRTRWHSDDFPVVLRAFQHDPLREGMLCLVGEGLVASPLDAVDLHLRSRFYPVLVVFAGADGTVRGARMLAFPSLCRGGTHYPELLHSSEIHAGNAGELLAERLLRLSDGEISPAVGRIEVEIGGGDGRGQLFQPDLQQWLGKVFKIGVAPAGASKSRAGKFLAKAVAIPPSSESRKSGATLRIGHDMIPTIAALVEPERAGEGAAEAFPPFLVAGWDAREPVVAIEFPPEARRSAARWPRLVQGPGRPLPESFPAAAIAYPAQRDTSDATLLVPIADAAPPADARPAITWVVDSRGWPDGGLAHAVHALSLQSGGAGDCLSFVGAPDALAQSTARERIAGAVNSFDAMEAAIAAAQTPIVGFVGPGVLLHDTRTAAALAALLGDEQVATASAAIVRVNQSGANWHAAIADGGAFVTSSGAKLGRNEREAITAFLWGTSYPVSLPGRHLWLARKASLAEWLKPSRGQPGNAVHVCSSEVSASHVGKESPAQVPPFVPQAADERATRVRALLG